MKLTADQARDLAQSFRSLSVTLGDYRFENWDDLTKAQRNSIEDAEWTLLNYSSDFITQAVGLTLEDTRGSLEDIQKATQKAQKTVERIKNIKKVIGITGAVIQLAGAIASRHPEAIISAVGGVATAIES